MWAQILKVPIFALADSKTWSDHWTIRSAPLFLNFTGPFQIILKANSPARRDIGRQKQCSMEEARRCVEVYFVNLILFRMK